MAKTTDPLKSSFSTEGVNDKLKGTLIIFTYSAVVLSLFLLVPKIFSFFTYDRGIFGFFDLIISPVYQIIAWGPLGGLIFYFLYDPVICPYLKKVPIWGKSIFSLYFVPSLIMYAIFGPLAILGGVLVSLLNLLTLDVSGSLMIFLGVIIQLLFGLAGSYIYAKMLDSKLSQYYTW